MRAVPAVPVTDTIKVVDASGAVVATPERATLVAVQTPQAFRGARAAPGPRRGRRRAPTTPRSSRRPGGRVVTVAGEPWNVKITAPDDLERSREWLARRRAASR